MSRDQSTHPVLMHGGIAFALMLTGLFHLPLMYLTGVGFWYSGKWVTNTLRYGSSRHSPVRTLAWSVGISCAFCALCLALTFVPTNHPHYRSQPEFNLVDMLVMAPFLFVIQVPFWYVLLLLLSIPGRVFGWAGRRREAEERALRLAEESRRMSAEQDILRRQQTDRVTEQRRRVDARAACEILYTKHAPEIGDRFSRKLFDAFTTTYMGDSFSADDVERRARELQVLIREHLEHVKPTERKPRTIQELAEWYLAEKTRIDALPLDEDLKQTHLMQLQYRYSELSDELLQKAMP